MLTPTNEFIDPMAFVQQSGQLTDANTQQPSIAMQLQQQPNVQPVTNLEQELARIHNSQAMPQSIQTVVSQMVSNPIGSPQIPQNTLVMDNLTYSDALKLPPDAAAINNNQANIDAISIAGAAAAAGAVAATIAKPVLDTQPLLQNVRKISRFQVSIVDPVMTTNPGISAEMAPNVAPTLPTNVIGSLTQSNESPEQIDKQMYQQQVNRFPEGDYSFPAPLNMPTTVNFSQLPTNFQPNQTTAVYHHQQQQQQPPQITPGQVGLSTATNQLTQPPQHMSGKIATSLTTRTGSLVRVIFMFLST